jgi:hypothetical protein
VEEYRVVGEGSQPSSGRPALSYYLIARREATGFEAPHTFFHSGEEVLPLFCSRAAAKRFLAVRGLGDSWHVRGVSVGELISLLFALHESVEWVLPSPMPGLVLGEDALSHLTSRDDFIGFLIES